MKLLNFIKKKVKYCEILFFAIRSFFNYFNSFILGIECHTFCAIWKLAFIEHLQICEFSIWNKIWLFKFSVWLKYCIPSAWKYSLKYFQLYMFSAKGSWCIWWTQANNNDNSFISCISVLLDAYLALYLFAINSIRTVPILKSTNSIFHQNIYFFMYKEGFLCFDTACLITGWHFDWLWL